MGFHEDHHHRSSAQSEFRSCHELSEKAQPVQFSCFDLPGDRRQCNAGIGDSLDGASLTSGGLDTDACSLVSQLCSFESSCMLSPLTVGRFGHLRVGKVDCLNSVVASTANTAD